MPPPLSLDLDIPRVRLSPAPPAPSASAASAAQAREPATLEADTIRGRTDGVTEAEGRIELKQGTLHLRAERLRYDTRSDQAQAYGGVTMQRDGDRFSGREVDLDLARQQGTVLDPTYFFARTQAGGRAERLELIDAGRSRLVQATYSSCALDGRGAPAWLLSADEVTIDIDANEGVARGAVLRFMGVPILGVPVLSFPVTGARKSGWLPPSINLDNKSGLELTAPYYWNIAPDLDATLAPTVMSRRGLGLDAELRYLKPHHAGELDLRVLPYDRAAGRSRGALHMRHGGDLDDRWRYAIDARGVSDDAYWEDFPRAVSSITPRLLSQHARVERSLDWLGLQGTAYARLQHWQVLDADDPSAAIVGPYQRSPQLGLRLGRGFDTGLRMDLESEFNRFTRPSGDVTPGALAGQRWHALGRLAWAWRASGAWIEPAVMLNLASYHTDTPMADGRHSASRAIPTFSIDGGLLFERDTVFLGRNLRQTLEPRVQFVATPWRDQSALPNFDAAGLDFNTVSIFNTNDFAGIDRVSDARHLTIGATSRWLDPTSGAESMRAGLVQRLLLRDQRLTPEGVPDTERLSDVLLFGSAAIARRWTLEGALQHSPNLDRTVRSMVTARYSPGPMRTLAASYRLVRGASEQLDVGWQWPVYRRDATASAPSGCAGGTVYSVGRVNYSTRDSRVTDSLLGFEVDAGCWIGRVVAERVSTGRSEATTRLMLQLELVGLSRLGSNPLQALKDNIPGYRLLREERDPPPPIPVYE